MTLTTLLSFAFVSLCMVLTPGPNMIYLISRSICQGKKAGFISLSGVGLGFIIYMLFAAFGITAALMTVPYIFDAMRILGALYLLWLAWHAFKPNSPAIFEKIEPLEADSNLKLFSIGLLTNLLNPKIAMMYLALLPQFINPEQNFFQQSLLLGSMQITISLIVNCLIVIFASKISIFLKQNKSWAQLQKYFMGSILSFLAIKILLNK